MEWKEGFEFILKYFAVTLWSVPWLICLTWQWLISWFICKEIKWLECIVWYLKFCWWYKQKIILHCFCRVSLIATCDDLKVVKCWNLSKHQWCAYITKCTYLNSHDLLYLRHPAKTFTLPVVCFLKLWLAVCSTAYVNNCCPKLVCKASCSRHFESWTDATLPKLGLTRLQNCRL